jgi:hypothetical protein
MLAREHVYRQAIARQLLIAEGVAYVRIPFDAEFASLQTREEGEISYLRFRRGIKDGSVPCYLHPDDAGYRGTELNALFRLYRRTHEDGTEHIHVDYTPAQDRKVEKRLFFLTAEELKYCEKDWPRFQCPQNANWYVVVAPYSSKLNVPKEAQAPKSDDPQLDRLIVEGWSVREDRGATLTLTKMTSKGEKTMTHHRRKKK